MAMQRTTYGQVRDRVLPGDVIAFLGDNPMSKAIQWAGGRSGVSHVGIIVEAGTAAREPQFTESSVHVDDNKVTYRVEVSSLRLSVDDYKGAVWWLPIDAAPRARFDTDSFGQFISGAIGQAFDFPGGLHVVSRDLQQQIIREHAPVEVQAQLQKGYCCSVLVANALRQAAVVPVGDPNNASPGDVCSWNIYGPDYYLLKGDAEIRIYNARPAGEA